MLKPLDGGLPRPATAAARVDVYGGNHKALRLFMGNTLALIGATDPGDPAEIRATLMQLDALLHSCEMHLRHEVAHLHPLLERAGATASAVDEHLQHRAASHPLRRVALQLAGAGPAERAEVLAQLYQAMALFVAQSFLHMHHEETVLGPLLWQHCDDAELRATEQAIVAALSPAELLRTLHWLLPALCAPERVALLQGLRASLPTLAQDAVWDLARARLPMPAYAGLARDLDVDPAPGLMARAGMPARDHGA